MIYKGYKAVIGLEIHAQLLTKSKMFCPDPVTYGGEPNTYVSPVSLGHPGTLPRVNRQGIMHAIRVGLATGCEITRYNRFARKNYFYADLPKGYQVSQHNTPICRKGNITITLPDGSQKDIRIHRIHVEEDSGKSLHDQDVYNSLVDLNRAGIGLIEIVSEADMTSPAEAAAYVSEIRKLVRYLGICDGNMEEGSLRCDANISVMKTDATEWGTKVEIKNMNSISNVAKAIEYEIYRQVEAVEKGEKIIQQTRTYDALNNRTIVMREKESSDDYRYFPEPDLQPVVVTEQWLHEIKDDLPELPHELYRRYTKELGLIPDDAHTIIEDKELAAYFDELNELTQDAKACTTWVLGPVKTWMNELAKQIGDFPLTAEKIHGIIELVKADKVSFSMAKDRLFTEMLHQPDADPAKLAEELDLIMVSDTGELEGMIDGILAANPGQVEAYKGGKTGLLGFFVGQVMKQTHGKANPKEVNELIRKKLG